METKTTIYAAFIAAQSEFGAASKGAINPHFKSRYADLATCLEAVLPALNKHGLALTYRVYDCDNGVRLEAVIIHTSGEEISSGILHLPVLKQDCHAYGSALTYGKRYLLQNVCALQTEDEDANAAVASMSGKAAYQAGLDKLTARNLRLTKYDISALEGDQMLAAEKFLASNGAKHLGNGVWESPVKLTRLDKYDVS